MEGGDLQVATWIKDEGFDTTIPSVMQVCHLCPVLPESSFTPCSCSLRCPPKPSRQPHPVVGSSKSL